MPQSRSRLRSELPNTAEKTLLLNKIKALYDLSARHLSFQVGHDRFNASAASAVVFDPSLGSNNIVFTRPSGATVKASLVVQDLTYTAKAAGTAGNSISITYANDGTAGAETVGVASSAITVHMESGVSTATQIAAAILASAPASALVSVAITGTAGTAQVTASTTSLAGGSATEKYDNADIRMIKRLRTKKWLLIIGDAANPA